MIILHPLSTKHLPDRDLTLFWFAGQEHPEAREFFVRGAVAWPEEMVQGFALLAGQDPKEKTIYVFEEYPFWTVEPYTKANPQTRDEWLAHPGLGQWLLQMWAKYRCRCFYWHQHPDLHRRYSLQVYQDKLIIPKPEFIDVPTVDELGDSLIVEYARLKKLHADQRMTLKDQLTNHMAVPEAKNPGMGIQALRCLLAGFEHAGWTEPRRRVKEKVVYV